MRTKCSFLKSRVYRVLDSSPEWAFVVYGPDFDVIQISHGYRSQTQARAARRQALARLSFGFDGGSVWGRV